MKRVHRVVFDDEKMEYVIYRETGGEHILLGRIDVASMLKSDYDKSIADVAVALGETIFLDSKSGIETAWQMAQHD